MGFRLFRRASAAVTRRCGVSNGFFGFRSVFWPADRFVPYASVLGLDNPSSGKYLISPAGISDG
jgi:hypothetical protein